MSDNAQKQAYQNFSKQDEAAKFFMRTSAQTSSNFVKYVDWTNTAKRLDYGCILDSYLTPPLPGDYIGFVARPGHKKSTLLAALAKRYASQIKDDEGKVVIFATWDESTESIENYISANYGGFLASDVAWGRVTKEQAIRAQIKRIEQLPALWVWGISTMDNEHKKPPFTPGWLFETIAALHQKEGIQVVALFLDYLQAIPVDGGERNRTAEVTSASKSAKSLAIDIGCPVFAGIQASRETEKYSDKIPGPSDGQHTSAIEQHLTKMVALMNPIKYLSGEELSFLDRGQSIDPFMVGGKPYLIDDSLLISRRLKQRGGRGAGTFPLAINQDTLEIYDVSPISTQLPPPGWKIENTL